MSTKQIFLEDSDRKKIYSLGKEISQRLEKGLEKSAKSASSGKPSKSSGKK